MIPIAILLDPEMQSYVALLTEVNETATGETNPEGSMIYYYEFVLPEPFDQIEGTNYWLSISAVSPDPQDLWRWQEAGRWLPPILCGAVDKNDQVPWAKN